MLDEARYRVGLVGHALREHGRHDREWICPPWMKWVMTAKCIVAVALGRENRHKPYDAFTVAHMNYHKSSSFEYGEGGDWESLTTGYHGLSYSVEWDGYP